MRNKKFRKELQRILLLYQELLAELQNNKTSVHTINLIKLKDVNKEYEDMNNENITRIDENPRPLRKRII